MLPNMTSLEKLRSTFTHQANNFLTQQACIYHDAAGVISKNDQLHQSIFESLIAIVKSNDLSEAKKVATHALHISNQLDSNTHFLLSCRMIEQKNIESDIKNLAAEFNNIVEQLAAELTVRHAHDNFCLAIAA